MRLLFCWLLLALAFHPGNRLLAAPEARTFILDKRPAAEVANQLQALYPAEELAISTQGQQIIARAEPPVLGEIEQLIDTMDVAAVQMRISVRSGHNLNAKSTGAGAVVQKDGDVGVGAKHRVTTTRNTNTRSVVVQNEASAQITSGQVRTLPVVLQGGLEPAAILDQVETRSGFVVSPRFISDQTVELTVMSFEEDPADAMPGYETEAVMTIRRVGTGQWVELGSSQSSQASNRAGVTYRTGGERQENQRFQVKVSIL